MSRSRGYCYTLNNYSEEEVQRLRNLEAVYHVFGEEVGESGTPHLQGFLYFKNAKTLSAVKKLVPRAHLESMRGTPEQASDYCKKDGRYTEFGKLPMSQAAKGAVNTARWDNAWWLAKQGRIEEIPADLRTRYFNTYKKIAQEYQVVPAAIETLEHEWYWGDSGTGKTRKAREENPGAYLKNPNKWWDGYVDQDVVVIDEWSPNHECLAAHLKQWADHHPFCAETKGSSKCIRPKKIIVTSNYSPEQCFTKEEDLAPIRRRFKVTHFNK